MCVLCHNPCRTAAAPLTRQCLAPCAVRYDADMAEFLSEAADVLMPDPDQTGSDAAVASRMNLGQVGRQASTVQDMLAFKPASDGYIEPAAERTTEEQMKFKVRQLVVVCMSNGSPAMADTLVLCQLRSLTGNQSYFPKPKSNDSDDVARRQRAVGIALAFLRRTENKSIERMLERKREQVREGGRGTPCSTSSGCCL